MLFVTRNFAPHHLVQGYGKLLLEICSPSTLDDLPTILTISQLNYGIRIKAITLLIYNNSTYKNKFSEGI